MTGGVLTERDNGRLVALTVDEEVSLRLSSEVVWGMPEVEGSAVTLYPVDYLVDPGFREWIIQAVATGTAVVRVPDAATTHVQATIEIAFAVEGPAP